MADGAPAPVVRRRSTLEPLALHPDLELGAGGEARVFALDADPSLVAKVYHAPGIAQARKVALMMATPPATDASAATLAWPCDLLLDRGGRFAGFLMPRAEGPRLFELYNPSSRRSAAPRFDHALLHRAGANLAAAFEALHAAGYVVGDVNESNVLVSEGGAVTLVDADSFQVRDPENGAVHRSHVGKPEFTPPELQGRHFADFDRAPEHDRFGLAVLLFLLLMEGTHPFAARMEGEGEAPPVEERIVRGLFPHAGRADCHPPRMAPPFALLDPALRALFVRAFVDGHADPAARPSPREWRETLLAAEARTAACAENARHRHGVHLDACPWCERTARLGGRDPFPAVPGPVRRPPARVSRPLPARPIARSAAAAAAPLTPVAKPVLSVLSVHPIPPRVGGGPGVAPWVSGLMGPSGIGGPVAWTAPLLWLFVLGPAQLTPVVTIVLLLLIARIAKHGPGRLGGATLGAMGVLLVGAAAVSALPWEPEVPEYAYTHEYDDDSFPASTYTDASRQVVVAPPYTEVPVDRGPELLSEGWLEERLLATLMDEGEVLSVRGEILLGVHVLADGRVDPDRIDVSEASDPRAAEAAGRIAAGLRFVPLTIDGEPAEARVWLRIRFDRAGVP